MKKQQDEEMDKYLGLMGESSFMGTCAAGGIVCNKSSQDVTGWDFILEFPENINSAPLADKISISIECKVQVKATDGLSKKIQIELSNLLRLCTYSLPAFIYLIEYDKRETPQNAYLLHIDKEIMFKVLKRSRENSVTSNRKKFNNATLTLPYDDSHRLHSISASCLKEKIQSHIPFGMKEYINKKISNLENLGYENGNLELKFTTSTKESINGLVDSLLGLGKKFNATDIKSFDNRFNISVPMQELSSEKAVFEITNVKSDSKGNIKFTNNHNGKTIRFPCEIFMNPVLFRVPKEFAKIRINCDQFDITLGLYTGKLNYTFSNAVVDCNLYKIRDIAMLMEWLWECECEIEISLHIDEFDKSIEYSANNNIKNSKDHDFIKNIKILNETVSNAIIIAEHMGLESYFMTNADNLMRNCRNLNYISRIISGDLTGMVFKFTANQDHKLKSKISDVCCIIVVSFTMHDIKVESITSFTGKATPSGIKDEYLLALPKLDGLKMIESKPGNNSSETIKKEIDKICSKFENDEITIIDFYNKEI